MGKWKWETKKRFNPPSGFETIFEWELNYSNEKIKLSWKVLTKTDSVTYINFIVEINLSSRLLTVSSVVVRTASLSSFDVAQFPKVAQVLCCWSKDDCRVLSMRVWFLGLLLPTFAVFKQSYHQYLGRCLSSNVAYKIRMTAQISCVLHKLFIKKNWKLDVVSLEPKNVSDYLNCDY